MTSPRILLNAWNLHAKKKLGQNFLNDPSTAEMIVARSGITAADVVLEIGAGLGALTVPLARKAGRVYALEKDHQMIEILKSELAVSKADNVVVLQKNILDMDIAELAVALGQKIVLMGNLPYNISSQIIVKAVKARQGAARAVFMLQKEMVQRISATPGSRDYGRLSVMLHYCAEIKVLAEVKAALFFPKPKVDSEVIAINFRKQPPFPADDEEFLFAVIKAAFGQRRKTLQNALAGSELHIDRRVAQESLVCAGIDPVRRAETLSVKEFVSLSRCLKAI